MSEDRTGTVAKVQDGKVKEWLCVIRCDPPKKTHQQQTRLGISKDGKARMYTEKGLQSTWTALLLSAPRPPRPLGGPIRLRIEVTWPWLAKDKKVRATAEVIPHDQKPDWDNMAKSLCDAMTTTGWWRDDKQVFDARVIQQRGACPGVAVHAVAVDRAPSGSA